MTEDSSVIKVIHADDSETAVKISVSHCQGFNPLTGAIEDFKSDRNKYSVFISASAGCFMKCSFCHLTTKKAKFHKLGRADILLNLKSALSTAVKGNPSLRERFIKLSWMGMGEAIADPEGVRQISIDFLDWVFENKLAVGLDGVDLATVMPDFKQIDLYPLTLLNKQLYSYDINPENLHPDNVASANFKAYSNRTPFRLFYSLHAVSQAIRDHLVPNAMPLPEAVTLLKNWADDSGCNLIIHQLILQDRNDSWEEIQQLVSFLNTNLPRRELRVLRYNTCARSLEAETEHFQQIIKYLAENLDRLKVQISPGKEVSAACGQFIVRQFVEKS